jgi:hypothetical protein
MVFVHPAPGVVGKVEYAYTNNGENGPPPRKIMDRLITGFIFFGGFFIVGILAFAALKPPPDAFLPGVAIAFVVGHVIGWLWPQPKVLTLYAGDRGAAWISGTRVHELSFDQLQNLEELRATFVFKGITTLHRELIATTRDGRRRTWFVGAAPDNDAAEDARYNFCSIVLDLWSRR